MKIVLGLALGFILISSAFVTDASAFMEFQALATASLEDCGSWERMYKSAKNTVNSDVGARFGTDEVSQRVADHVTSGGTVSDAIGKANEMAAKLVSDCPYTKRSFVEVLGDFNQNIIDSVKIYKKIDIKDIKQTTSKNEVKKIESKSVKLETKSNTKKIESKTTKKASFEKCGVWEQSYKINRDTANYNVETLYGEEEVSKRVADYVTGGGAVSDSIGKVNEVTVNLVQNCGYTKDLVSKVLGGGFNQNIIDSVKIYKKMDIKDIKMHDVKQTAKKEKNEKPVKKETKKEVKKSESKTAKKTSLEVCGSWARVYTANKDIVNGNVESVYGKDEVSQRVADLATNNGGVSDAIGRANDAVVNLIGNCGYDDRSVTEVLGNFHQNIIDSVEIYKGMSIRAIK